MNLDKMRHQLGRTRSDGRVPGVEVFTPAPDPEAFKAGQVQAFRVPAGARGYRYRTEDGGVTWTVDPRGAIGGRYVIRDDGVIVGGGGGHPGPPVTIRVMDATRRADL